MNTLANAKMESLKDKINKIKEEVKEKGVKVKTVTEEGSEKRVKTKVNKLD